MKSRKTYLRAVSPKITPYSCVLICCHYLYMIALHSTLSLNMRISDIKLHVQRIRICVEHYIDCIYMFFVVYVLYMIFNFNIFTIF